MRLAQSRPSPRSLPPDEGRPSRRRRTRLTVRPLPVLLLVLGGWFAWASTTEGGVSARVDDIVESVRDLLTDATTDPGLKRGATYFNDRYEREGAYPDVTDLQLEQGDEGGWSIGVDVVWCSPRAIVLQGLTGSGTTSRLLLDGKDLGDVRGEVGCPADLTEPAPWVLPDSTR